MKIILLLILFFISGSASAQEKKITTIKTSNLKVGDRVPDLWIPKVLNYKKKNIRISEYKNKLLILDFWSLTCKACIEAFPRIDSLRKVFGDKIEILPVTYESENQVSSFFKRSKFVKDLVMPSVVEDKLLSSWFKHYALPHEVWIYKGVVKAITTGEYLDGPHISEVLNGKTINWPVKNDYFIIEKDKPLIDLKVRGTEKQIINYVAMMGYLDGGGSSIGIAVDSISKTKRSYIINYPIVKAYVTLWKELVKTEFIAAPALASETGISPNQLVLEVKDRSKYIYNPSFGLRDTWDRKNRISYESMSANFQQGAREQYQSMITDLNRFLGLSGYWEKRKTKCLSLIRTSKQEDKLRTKGGEVLFTWNEPVKKIRNNSLDNLVYWLNNFEENPPVFDETNYSGPVDMDIPVRSWIDIAALRKALSAYGLDLKETVKEIDFFILKENQN